MAESQEKHRVVIVGAGFAGFNAARELTKLVGATTEIVVINSTWVPHHSRGRLPARPHHSPAGAGVGGR
jgi:NADH dehydrogenase FAD-containing subunit